MIRNSIEMFTSINVTTPGNVEARVMCFYRRSEIPASLVPLADKHHWGEVVDTMDGDSDDEDTAGEKESNNERAALKQREV